MVSSPALKSSASFEGEIAVPNLVTHDDLRELISSGQLLQEADTINVEGVKYDFTLGSRFLKASFERPVDYDELSESDKKDARVEPGEVVFVMSKEKVVLPNDMMIILSQKRKIAHEGISIMGGLCVDPGYEGYLLVGLYNFSSDSFRLHPGRKLIAGLFYRLGNQEIADFPKPETRILDFPDDLVRLIKSYQPINVGALHSGLETLRLELKSLRDEIEDDRKWKDEFKRGLEGLLHALEQERDNREEQFSGLKSTVDQTKDRMTEIDKSLATDRTNRAWIERLLWPVVALVIGAAFANFMGWLRIP